MLNFVAYYEQHIYLQYLSTSNLYINRYTYVRTIYYTETSLFAPDLITKKEKSCKQSFRKFKYTIYRSDASFPSSWRKTSSEFTICSNLNLEIT